MPASGTGEFTVVHVSTFCSYSNGDDDCYGNGVCHGDGNCCGNGVGVCYGNEVCCDNGVCCVIRKTVST